ncbi:MAG: CvpA family protein [Candidatus Latescibacterota bacterium]|jgi:membrane protein required for colicin V production
MEGFAVVNMILLSILTVGTIAGLVKGLVRQVIELVGIVVSFFIAVLFAGWLAAILQEHTALPYSPSLVIAALAIFVGGTVGFHFLAMSIRKLVHLTFLGWVDRMCGGILGLIIGMIVASLLVWAALELPVSNQVRRAVENSSVSMFVQPIAPWLFDFVFEHGDKGIDFHSIFKRSNPI